MSDESRSARARSGKTRRRQPAPATAGGGHYLNVDSATPADHGNIDDNQLVVRLKDHKAYTTEAERPKSRLGQLNPFSRDAASPRISMMAPPPKSDLKETLKRPLSSLFRRPTSKAGNRDQSRSTEVSEVAAIDSADTVSKAESVDKAPFNLDTVARAPEFHVNHISAAYNFDLPGLDNPEIKKFGDLDLTPLMRFLQLEEEVIDETVPWTWDYLYVNILTETRENEWDVDEELPEGF
uniref:Intraflagellar transport protein 43 n=1 Tax=Panagrellus redivivus TaxID=6233 RepID=A0A7E4VCE5_PANRE